MAPFSLARLAHSCVEKQLLVDNQQGQRGLWPLASVFCFSGRDNSASSCRKFGGYKVSHTTLLFDSSWAPLPPRKTLSIHTQLQLIGRGSWEIVEMMQAGAEDS